MSTTSVLAKQDKLHGKRFKEDHVTDKRSLPVAEKMQNNLLVRKLFFEFVELGKSVVLIFALLLLYKVSGFHAFWLDFIGSLV